MVLLKSPASHCRSTYDLPPSRAAWFGFGQGLFPKLDPGTALRVLSSRVTCSSPFVDFFFFCSVAAVEFDANAMPAAAAVALTISTIRVDMPMQDIRTSCELVVPPRRAARRGASASWWASRDDGPSGSVVSALACNGSVTTPMPPHMVRLEWPSVVREREML